MSILLTDDEVVALCALVQTRRLPVLATVDTEDAAATRAAVGRGLRSLSVRELATDETGFTALEEFAACLAGDARLTLVHLTNDDQADLARNRVSLVSAEGGSWFEHRITGTGVHGCTVVDLDDALRSFSEVVASQDKSTRLGLLSYDGASALMSFEVLTDGVIITRSSDGIGTPGETPGLPQRPLEEWHQTLAHRVSRNIPGTISSPTSQ